MKLIPRMMVKNKPISIGLQCLILNCHLKEIDKFEIVTFVIDWLDCNYSEAVRIVDSVIGVTTSELRRIS